MSPILAKNSALSSARAMRCAFSVANVAAFAPTDVAFVDAGDEVAVAPGPVELPMVVDTVEEELVNDMVVPAAVLLFELLTALEFDKAFDVVGEEDDDAEEDEEEEGVL